jgi:CxxC-x17-CxxC domain-containing protein
MKNFDNIFDREKRNTSRESDFKRRDSGKKRFGGGDRDRGRPQMHDATCSECGRKCQVPFMPSNDKPVYCSECFTNRGGGQTSDRPERREYEKPRFQDKKMFDAVCATCGRKFELPFKPSEDRPVYCKDCFDKGADSSRSGAKAGDRDQFEALNAKLDRILKILTPSVKEEKKEAAIEKKEIAIIKKEKPKKQLTAVAKKEKPKKETVAVKKEVKKAKKVIVKKVVVKKKAKK